MKNLFKTIIACILVALMAVTVCAHECKFQQMRNDASHWEECLECGEFRNAANHTFENNVCTVCGITKNEGAVHYHSFTKMRNDASHWEECLECGEFRNAANHTFENNVCTVCGITKNEGAVHYHSFTKMRNDASHWEECLECGEFRNAANHTFEDKRCTVCGIDEPIIIDNHDHRYIYEKSLESHWQKCRICNEARSGGKHTFENGACVECGMLVPNNPFRDVGDDDWFCTDVIRAYAFGLINGKNSPDTFLPQDYMTYAEAIKLAACMNELYETGKVTLTNGTPWYQTYVDYCKRSNIITKEYNYNELVTRQGYMEIFARALPDSALEAINNVPENFVPDVPSSSEYAEAIYKLYAAGILAGVDEKHNCNPTANIKRCEVAAIISRMMDETQRLFFSKFDSEEEKPDDQLTDGGTGNIEIGGHDSIIYGYVGETYTYTKGEDLIIDSLDPVAIKTQPAAVQEARAYGEKIEVSVVAEKGYPEYSYQWKVRGFRNEVSDIVDGGCITGSKSDALYLVVDKDNPLIGKSIFCEVTDKKGNVVESSYAVVYGPFSMKVDTMSIVQTMKKYTLAGRVDDGLLRKGEKVSVIRNGKVIAIGIAEDLQMFNKSMDETVKGDNVGIVFTIESGATPLNGDIVVKYLPSHVLDTSDIVN